MSAKTHFIINLAGAILTGIFFTGLMLHAVRFSTDRPKLIGKWLLSIIIIIFLAKIAFPLYGKNDMSAMGGLTLALTGFVILMVMWRHDIIEQIGRPFSSLYDGGGAELETKTFYSIARAKQKMGRYAEAIAEARKQLEKFPNDFEGQMLIAEIQAEGQLDVPAAEITVQRLCNQKGHSSSEIISALNALADWHLKYTRDVEAARMHLEKIVELYPGSEFALVATQRVAHLTQTDQVLRDRHEHRKIVVVEGVQYPGLASPDERIKSNVKTPEEEAAEYVEHLEKHPLDMEVRERLAVIYATHYRRLDLTTDQLEQMIHTNGQQAKNIVRWLNLLADLQVKLGSNYDTVKQTLERIVEISPDTASANMARTRIAYLRLQLKGQNEQRPSVKLGNYEQDIGLKG